MKKTLLTLLALTFCFALDGYSTVPMRRWFRVKQTDGSSLCVRKHGNGQFLFYTTQDGKVLVRDQRGNLCYAVKTPDGLVASSKIAHQQEERSMEEQHFVETIQLSSGEAYKWMVSKTKSTSPSTRAIGSDGDGLGIYGKPNPDGVVSSIGEPLIPIIMVSFSNRDFLETTTPEKVERMMNEEGYADEEHCVGSVKDYFTSQSNGMFKPSFEVVAQVKLPNDYAYYGANYSSGRIDKKVGELIQTAIDSAVHRGVDFSKYTDGNGVPLISIYYAGPGEHSAYEEGCEDFLWAHFSERTFAANDEINIRSYFVGNETLQEYGIDEEGKEVVIGTQTDGIGVFIHEFGHALGLPDFYYTGSSNSVASSLLTLDFWSIMDYGQYMYDGYAPIGYLAYERSMMGWLEIEEPIETGYHKLYSYDNEADNAKAYILRNPNNAAEYYLLENRQSSTWYPERLGSGMLVTHVDYSSGIWRNNTVNNDPDRQRFEFLPADGNKSPYNEEGRFSFDNFKGDLFPGLRNIQNITEETTPTFTINEGEGFGHALYDITEDEGVISFCYNDASLVAVERIKTKDTSTAAIYTLTGKRLNQSQGLPKGVYILKEGNKIKKIFN